MDDNLEDNMSKARGEAGDLIPALKLSGRDRDYILMSLKDFEDLHGRV